VKPDTFRAKIPQIHKTFCLTSALAGRPFDVFDDLLAMAFACSGCLSHLPLVLSRTWLLWDTGAVARHGIYAGDGEGRIGFHWVVMDRGGVRSPSSFLMT
jgi:hypothetical protein